MKNITARLDEADHAMLVGLAKEENRSLNQMIVLLIRKEAARTKQKNERD